VGRGREEKREEAPGLGSGLGKEKRPARLSELQSAQCHPTHLYSRSERTRYEEENRREREETRKEEGRNEFRSTRVT